MNDIRFPELVPITTSRLLLRKIEIADAEDILECLADPEVTDRMMHCPVLTLDEMRLRIEAYIREYKDRVGARYGVDLNGKMIGSVMLTPIQNPTRAVLGFYINRSFWGKGYAAECVRAMLGFGFEVAGLNRIEASCFSENIASARVMERCGMKYEGRAEDYYLIEGKQKSILRYVILKRHWEVTKPYANADR